MFFLLVFCLGCENPLTDDYKCKTLTSSKGEKIYVKSINWGVTGDYQRSIITKSTKKLTVRTDTIGSIEGYEPFIYHFKNDTLTLFFYDYVTYRIKEKFKTISVNYLVLNDDEFLSIQDKIDNKYYFSVPSY